MSEVELDQYQTQELDQMIAWCQTRFTTGTWKVIFDENNTRFEFDRGRDAVTFSQHWKQ
jgi:hypothetical protein